MNLQERRRQAQPKSLAGGGLARTVFSIFSRSPDTTKEMNWSAIASFLLALAVGLGAFGAHGLKGRLDEYALSIYEKAVFYHFIHAVGILVVTLAVRSLGLPAPAQNRICWLLFLGILFFSGSLYALAVSGVRILGAITPLGGVAFIAAWVWLGVELLRARV